MNVTVKGIPDSVDCGPIVYQLIDEQEHDDYLKLIVNQGEHPVLELKYNQGLSLKKNFVADIPVIIKASLTNNETTKVAFFNFNIKIGRKSTTNSNLKAVIVSKPDREKRS